MRAQKYALGGGHSATSTTTSIHPLPKIIIVGFKKVTILV